MSALDYQAWRVVETRLDHQLRNESEHVRTHIGTQPMTEFQARQLATQEMGRHAGSDPKRTFHAEPVPEPVAITYETTSGHTIAYIDGVKFGAVWGPAVDDPEAWFLATVAREPCRIHTRYAAERELNEALKTFGGTPS